ncbi:hypothetical protein BDV59DRAFT_193964 [Aspergillus ambiguus]|uniref:uncharacterized protein n=1 Tax=Aspergillus ambiguus TaxID=176160 RepID=UPI003CCDB4A1
MDNTAIRLVDNTAPARRLSDDEAEETISQIPTASTDLSRNASRRWRTPSVRTSLRNRRYAKWQPQRLGIVDTNGPSDDGDLAHARSNTNTLGGDSLTSVSSYPTTEPRGVDTADFAASSSSGRDTGTAAAAARPRPGHELDILYENQRGWFFFGIPLYSHRSLLNLDPSAWVTGDLRDSPVDITNAQLPDPSWEWAWMSWYVDMSGDVDDQGWQYSFSFSSTAWHGSHPWFHSFVRRRRWVRLRVKRASERRRPGRSEFEMAHRLNEDYFTIHSAAKSRAASIAEPARRRMEAPPLEEIANIPTLLHAMRTAVVDREKIEALNRFLHEGGDELYYLDEKMPEIMSLFVFQASRWQFLTHVRNLIDELARDESTAGSETETENIRRQREYLEKAADTASRHLTGPEVFSARGGGSAAQMLNLTPSARKGSLISKHSRNFSYPPMTNGGRIKGIPRRAEVGHHLSLLTPSSPPPLLPFHDSDDAFAASILMFSRGHPCLKRRGLAAVLDTVAAGPEEPLLFLYPRWVTSAARQRRPLSSIASPSPAPRPSRRLSFGAASRRWLSNSAVGANPTPPVDNAPQKNTPPDGPEKSLADRSEKTTQAKGPVPGSVLPRKGRRVFNAFSDLDLPTPASSSPSTPKGNITRTTRSAADKALVAMKRLSVRDRRKLRYRVFLSKQLQERGVKNRPNQWAKIRDLLEQLQEDARVWTKKGTRQKELLIPEETVALLAGVTDMAMKENIWYVPVHNGCRVHVLHPRESEGQYRKVILSGSERVVELVGDRIMHARDLQAAGAPLVDIRKPRVPVFPSIDALKRKGHPVPLVRGVWDFYTARGRPAKFDLILAASENLSTVREFAEHVEELTRSQALSYKRVNGRPQAPHARRVAKAVVKLLLDDANRDLLSTAALNRALAFLCEHDFLRFAKMVFLRAEHIATVDTFNILLKSAAKRQDAQFFRQYLLVMSRMNIRPDSYTWVAFLDCLVSPKAKANVLIYALQKGYLNQTGAVRSALQLTIQDTFLTHLESGKSVDSFFNMAIDTYGTNWFPPSLINQMFSVTVRLKDFQAMDRLLEICRQQGFSLNGSTINQIVLLFRSDIFSALRYLWRCSDQPEKKLGKDAWERLFLVAFKGRHYNICRVLWRYACINEAVTYKMKQAVLSSLARNVARKKGKDIDNVWRTSAGKIIVGVDLHLASYPQKSSVLDCVPPEFHENPVSYLASGFKADGEDRQRQLRLAATLTQRDIEVGSWYRATRPLGIMLEAAAVMDREWKDAPRPTQWLMQNAINVPVTQCVYPR